MLPTRAFILSSPDRDQEHHRQHRSAALPSGGRRSLAFAAGVTGVPTTSRPAGQPGQPIRSGNLVTAARFDEYNGSGGAATTVAAAAGGSGLEPRCLERKPAGCEQQQQQQRHLLPALVTHQCPVCCRLFLDHREAEEHMQGHAAAVAAATGVPDGQQVAPPAVPPHLVHQHPAAVACSSASSGVHYCFVCSKSFATASNLRTHMLLHMGKKPHTCQVCGKQFSASSNLKAHAVVHTGERRFRCADCGKAFATSSHLKTHAVVHSGRRPYQCEICLREFSVSSNLRSHMFVHTGERRHECQVCGKQFSSSSHVKTHMLTHSGERPHKCDLCPKAFAVISNLKAHRKIHLGQKDHACDVCGKRFYTSSDMKSHRTMHTGERPHQCDVCHERFGKRSNMKAHMMTHTGDRPFHCQRCPKRFAKASTLRTHAAKWHPPEPAEAAPPSTSASRETPHADASAAGGLSVNGTSVPSSTARSTGPSSTTDSRCTVLPASGRAVVAANPSEAPRCITSTADVAAADGDHAPSTAATDRDAVNSIPVLPHSKVNGSAGSVDAKHFADHPRKGLRPPVRETAPASRYADGPVAEANGRAKSAAVASNPLPSSARAGRFVIQATSAGHGVRTKDTSRGVGQAFGAVLVQHCVRAPDELALEREPRGDLTGFVVSVESVESVEAGTFRMTR
ncbi:uncharacterized protein [Dermacentor albipictus]|uniref:uncharacterized protein isoform X2 n=1 Tax=Dermacentor albipictus TaxID=60249 RepID=UPI0038FC8C97